MIVIHQSADNVRAFLTLCITKLSLTEVVFLTGDFEAAIEKTRQHRYDYVRTIAVVGSTSEGDARKSLEVLLSRDPTAWGFTFTGAMEDVPTVDLNSRVGFIPKDDTDEMEYFLGLDFASFETFEDLITVLPWVK